MAVMLAATNGLTDPGILLSSNGNNLTVADGINFVTDSSILYILNGNLTTSHGSITMLGATGIPPLASNYHGLVSLNTLNGGNILLNQVFWPRNLANPSTDTLFVNSANNIYINSSILGMFSSTNLADNIVGTPLSLGSLKLSAAYTDQSITTGPVAIISVFNLNGIRMTMQF